MVFRVIDNELNEAAYTVSINGNDAFNVVNDKSDSESNQNSVISDASNIIDLILHNKTIPLKYQKYNIFAIQNYVNNNLVNCKNTPNVEISMTTFTNNDLPLILARNRKLRRDAHNFLRNHFNTNLSTVSNDENMDIDDYLKLADGTIHHIDKNESNNDLNNLVLISYMTHGEHNRKIESSINYLFDNYFDSFDWKSNSVSLNIPIYYFDSKDDIQHKDIEITIK